MRRGTTSRSVLSLFKSARSATELRRELALARLGDLLAPRVSPVRVVRPDDLLAIDFYLHNLTLLTNGTARLVRTNPARAAILVAQ